MTLSSIRGKPGLAEHALVIDFLLYCIRGPSLPIPCHTYSESSDQSRYFGSYADHLTGQKIGKGYAKGGGETLVYLNALVQRRDGLYVVYIFRHARVSSTYPCMSVRWSVTLSDFQPASVSGRPT